MTRAHPTDAERFSLRATCEFCDAAPNHWCHSHLRPRNVVRSLHQVRLELAAYKRRERLTTLLELTQNDPRVARAIAEVERG